MGPDHQAAVNRFFAEVWGADTTVDSERAKPDSPAFGCLIDGRMVGYIGTLPVRFWDGHSETSAHWLKGFMVLPEYRGSAVGYAVLKTAIAHLNIVGSLSVARDARRLFEASGLVERGALANLITPIRADRMLSQLNVAALGFTERKVSLYVLRILQTLGLARAFGALLNTAFSVWRRWARGRQKQLSISESPPSETEANDLWSSVKGSIGASPIRDALYLNHAYPDSVRADYDFVSVYRKEKLTALLVLRKPGNSEDRRLNGTRVAVISDLIVNPDDAKAAEAALTQAERIAASNGTDAILCSASHARLRRLLKKSGFLEIPGNIHFLLRSSNHDLLKPSIGEWWLTRRDGYSDEIF